MEAVAALQASAFLFIGTAGVVCVRQLWEAAAEQYGVFHLLQHCGLLGVGLAFAWCVFATAKVAKSSQQQQTLHVGRFCVEEGNT